MAAGLKGTRGTKVCDVWLTACSSLGFLILIVTTLAMAYSNYSHFGLRVDAQFLTASLYGNPSIPGLQYNSSVLVSPRVPFYEPPNIPKKTRNSAHVCTMDTGSDCRPSPGLKLNEFETGTQRHRDGLISLHDRVNDTLHRVGGVSASNAAGRLP